MSGKYMYIGRDDDKTFYTGTTHGCTCCSRWEDDLTVEQIEEHIRDLEEDLARARKALEYTRTMTEMIARVKAESAKEG